MAIKFCVFDVGQVCYPYTLQPLNNFFIENTENKDVFNKNGGVKSFDYDPFMKGEINFTHFCKNLCLHCGMYYTEAVEFSIDEAMHKGVGAFFDETLKIIFELRNVGIEICLLSNAFSNLENTVQKLTTKDKIFASYELGLLKPDIAIYEQVLQKLRAKPEEVIFIDDKFANVEAAKSVGIYGIVFNKDTIGEEINKILANS